MRFLMLYRPATNPTQPIASMEEHRAELGKLIEEMAKAGTLISTGAMIAGSARVNRTGSEYRASEGAAPELGKQPVVGYALVQHASKEEAIAGAKRFLAASGEGDCEIFPLMDGPEP